MFKKILITGGAGYVGSLLTPQLLKSGYQVSVYDALFFGRDVLPLEHPNLTLIEGDIRDSQHFENACQGVDAIIHLACISNDASFALDEALSTSINLDAFEPLVMAAKRAGVKRFINASTSSVYGVSDAKEITETHPLVPLTLYNKYKGMCEPLLFKHTDADFVGVTIRPATVCGYSPRLRLDLTVNILTNHALTNGKITVFGGEQLRPNIHIQDMCNLYEFLLTVENEKIANQTFNAGYQNHTVSELAEIVKQTVEKQVPSLGSIEIARTDSDDIRSYHINSDKLKQQLGFQPQFTVTDAVVDLCHAFKTKQLLDTMVNDWYYNVRYLKQKEVV